MAEAKRREIPENEELAKRKQAAESPGELEIEVKKPRIQDPPDLVQDNGDLESNEKGPAILVDKGKGKMVVLDEEDDDDSSDDDDESRDGALGEDDESDLSDDPLAEVDLSNILPSKTRRKHPPVPGAYLVNDADEDDEDDDDDDDEVSD